MGMWIANEVAQVVGLGGNVVTEEKEEEQDDREGARELIRGGERNDSGEVGLKFGEDGEKVANLELGVGEVRNEVEEDGEGEKESDNDGDDESDDPEDLPVDANFYFFLLVCE